MDYEKKLALAKEALDSGSYDKETIEYIFPELKESEDERVRKELLEFLDELSKLGKNTNFDRWSKSDCADWICWLEKQGEQKLQIEKLPFEMKTIGESLGFTTHEECDKYNQMVTDIIMSADDNGEQNPADKLEPKFHKGEWIVWKDKCYKVNYNGCGYELVDQDGLSTSLEYGTIDENAHIWDVTTDAKDGDVLISRYNKPFIYNGNWNSLNIGSYCGITTEGMFNVATEKCYWTGNVNIHPATKEQRDLLFSKMKESDYKWDAEKKELKKIDNEEVNGEDYGIDGLWHAQRILEKTLGEVDGYQTDDGILDHKAAITAVKKLYGQEPTDNEMKEALRTEYEKGRADVISEFQKAWSEEDESYLNTTIAYLKDAKEFKKTAENCMDWLKSLKDRVQPRRRHTIFDEII